MVRGKEQIDRRRCNGTCPRGCALSLDLLPSQRRRRNDNRLHKTTWSTERWLRMREKALRTSSTQALTHANRKLEEGGRAAEVQGISIPGPSYAICYAYAVIRHHRIPRKLTTSHTRIPTKVNISGHNQQPRNHQEALLEVFWVPEHVYDVAEDSRRRLHLDLNADTTLSSYPRFRTPYTAPEYAEPFVLAFFGSLIPFPAVTDSAGAIFGSFAVVCTPFPPHPYLHVPSASGSHPIASEDTQDGEFAILVVPEAKERASGMPGL
ncbi:hypothetical protein Moror_5116 [Moniliophthora roreri MCA 2997]|uniref:Uncharacterized protein n=1 Tax=Moniliophthora roreri (strain MCA 2997) TaxID=1381753 RepID=V2WGG7_MONRO|nr:hypothetical protein Moror_5116 [Moniliophthora roreri MCA 2997]